MKEMTEKKIDFNSEKSLSFHTVTPCMSTIGIREYISKIFDIIILDNKTTYLFKTYPQYWYSDKVLNELYNHKHLSIKFNTLFRDETIPKRCECYFDTFYKEVFNYLKTVKNKTRIHKIKLKTTIRYLIKNISRLKYHRVFTLLYCRGHEFWSRTCRNVPRDYLLGAIDYLISTNKVRSFNGFQQNSQSDNKNNIMSMLIILPDFIDKCNGYGVNTKMDECLREPTPTVWELRKYTDKKKHEYKLIKPNNKEDIVIMNEAIKNLTEYNNSLLEREIVIGGKVIPEYFLRRIHTENMSSGGRLYDRGDIQGASEYLRSTVLIDNQKTKELDFKGLHYAFAASEVGYDLRGKDPYDFDFKIDVDYDAIHEWKLKNNVNKDYDPVRNLKKTALLIMFNANDKRGAVSAISSRIKKDYTKQNQATRKYVGLKNIPVTKLVESMIEANNEISEYFCSGAGLKFQYLDSEIIMYCIDKFMEVGEVFLPVHDSLIVREGLEDFTMKTMKDGFEYVMGNSLNCVVEIK